MSAVSGLTTSRASKHPYTHPGVFAGQGLLLCVNALHCTTSPLLCHFLILQSLQYLNNPFQITPPISLIACNSFKWQYFPPCWLTASNYSVIMLHWLFLFLCIVRSSVGQTWHNFNRCTSACKRQSMYIKKKKKLFPWLLHLLAPITRWVEEQALL